jgi:hypothetical protein
MAAGALRLHVVPGAAMAHQIDGAAAIRPGFVPGAFAALTARRNGVANPDKSSQCVNLPLSITAPSMTASCAGVCQRHPDAAARLTQRRFGPASFRARSRR